MTSAESSDKTPGEEPLLKAVEAVWKHYPKNNAFDGYGAVNVDLEGDNNKPIHMTVEEAKADVIAKGYVGFTYATGTRQMWRLKSVGSPSGGPSASALVVLCNFLPRVAGSQPGRNASSSKVDSSPSLLESGSWLEHVMSVGSGQMSQCQIL